MLDSIAFHTLVSTPSVWREVDMGPRVADLKYRLAVHLIGDGYGTVATKKATAMEMHQVRYFLAVTDAENFTRAAEACNVAQPSLTKAIQKLEEELGGPLFHRERGRTIQTELGRRVYPHINTLAEATKAVKLDAQDFHEGERATIRLGVMATIAPGQMVGFLSRLRQEVPALDLDLREMSGPDLISTMQEGTLDVALLAMPDLPDSFAILPLYTERYVIAFPVGHAFASQDNVPIDALAEVDYLKRVHCEFTDHFEALGTARPLGVNVRYSSEREDWVQAMVAAGLGCSIMPENLTQVPGIGIRPLSDPAVSREISLVTVAGRRHSPALAAMIRLAKRYSWPGES